MHLGRLGARAIQRESDLGDPSCGCGCELVLVDMNLWLWTWTCGCGHRLVELVAVVMNFLWWSLSSDCGYDLLIVVMILWLCLWSCDCDGRQDLLSVLILANVLHTTPKDLAPSQASTTPKGLTPRNVTTMPGSLASFMGSIAAGSAVRRQKVSRCGV
jgi:hypothetical protein